MKRLATIATCLLLLPVAFDASASEPPEPPNISVPPALFVQTGERSVPLSLSTVDVDVKIVGNLAETQMTLTFANPNDRALAGDLYFPLPEGATVSGYALDIAGELVDGVVVGKDRARQIFETEVRKGVDPGLVEWTRGNSFKTRVFPIPARGSRTIRVSYVAPLDETKGGAVYRLPLRFDTAVGDFHARLEVVKATVAPVVASGDLGASFTRWRDSFVAEARLKDKALSEDLVVRIPDVLARPVQVERSADAKTYVLVRDHARTAFESVAPRVERLRIVWDASRSRADDHAAELKLLERWLRSLRNETQIELVVFRDAPEATRRFTAPGQIDALLAAIRGVPYDGGTQLGATEQTAGAKRFDAVLLFSDGLSTFGAGAPDDLGGPVFAINADAVASHDTLRHVARATGGAYLNLARVTEDAAMLQLGRTVFAFLGAEVVSGKVDALYPRLPEPVVGPTDVTGILQSDEAVLELRWGVGDRVLEKRRVTLRRGDASEGELLRRNWAQAKVRDLLAFPKDNAAAIVELGKAHGVVTPGTSLLVLETFDQYVEHDVRPPTSLADMRGRWDALKKERRQDEQRTQRDKLAEVLAMWKARVEWWSTTFDYPKNFRFGDADEAKAEDADGDSGVGMGGMGLGAAAPAAESAPVLEREVDAAPRAMRVSAAKKEKKKGDVADAGPDAAIALKRWDPSTPYLAELKKAKGADRYRIYLEQRESYGDSPAFFLDCADHFRPHDAALAMRILSNIAELELEEPALLRVLAHRLAQLEELDLAARLFAQVLDLRPEEPQSYRDLALVLARRAEREGATKDAQRADYQRALDLLAKVVMGHWDRFAEIELMALTEANRIWPRADEAGVTRWPLDKRLRKLLDLDVRIVMTWDADMTDMDLHVIEPSSEEAYYSHNRTTIGGMVSRDFTQGYGPEVYALRRGMHGTYKIRSKFFGSSAADLIGAVTLQVEVFTNYGRSNEQRRAITFRLTEREESLELGEIEL